MMSDQYNPEYGQAVSDHRSHKQRMSGQLSREHEQGMLAQPYHENDQRMPGQPGHECEQGMLAQPYHENDQRMPGQPGHECEQGMPAQAYHENGQRMAGQPGHECEQGILAQRGHDHQQKMLAQPSHEYGHSMLAQTSHDHRETTFGQRVTASGWPMPVVLHPYTFYRFALPGLGLPPADKLPLSQCARPVWLGNLATLARDCGISIGTARHCIRALVDAKWIVETKVAPKITAFTLRSDWLEQRFTELQRVVQRIEQAPYRGEALAKEWSTLLADIDPGSGEVVDNARPEFLVNPDTNQPLEYDRWFKQYGVAIEFNGKQHYGATERYPDVRAAARTRVHDYVKYGLSRDHGVTLITLTPSELNYPTIWRHLAGVLPLRSVSLDDPVLQYLTERSHSYARYAERAERTG
ncbi:MAG: hypothetical protein IMX01_08340 [Limnochordaceae bacterium]|nr:hypothetical protein [Limnochordaceae bacterium]